jgi:hypothetical protein
MYVDGVFEWHSASDILFLLFPFSLSVVPSPQPIRNILYLRFYPRTVFGLAAVYPFVRRGIGPPRPHHSKSN